MALSRFPVQLLIFCFFTWLIMVLYMGSAFKMPPVTIDRKEAMLKEAKKREHLLAVRQSAGANAAELGDLNCQIGELYYSVQLYKQGEPYMLSFLSAARAQNSYDKQSLTQALCLVANFYRDWRRFSKAEAFYQRGRRFGRQV